MNKKRRGTQIVAILCVPALFYFLINLCSLGLPLAAASEDNITPTAAIGDATTSLAIGGADKDTQVKVGFGETGYSNHTVTISGSNIESYALTITGPAQISGTTSIAGADNAIGSNLTDNTWGYSYGQTGANASRTYKSFSGKADTLETATTTSGTLASQTKDLIFAIKFGEEAEPGRYFANIVLALTATPRDIVGIWSTGKDSGIRTMQKMGNNICAQVSAPAATATTAPTMILQDTRDNSYYTIAKLPDGNCWMTENLHLVGQKNLNAADGKTLTSADTDISANYSLPATQTGEKPNFNKSSYTQAESYYQDNNKLAKHGVYYTYAAATAGTAPSSGSASNSICPRGWKLPAQTGTTSYATLMSSASISTNASSTKRLYAAPYNLTTSGTVEGTTYSEGYTDLWIGAAQNTQYGYNIRTNTDGTLMTSDTSARYRGLPMRCVADPNYDGSEWGAMTTMQQMTPEICASAAVDATKTLTDTRDGNTYTIRKHEDNRCWMTQNLRLRGNTNNANSSSNALTSNDSDVASNYTLPTTATSISSNYFNSSYPNQQQSYYYSSNGNVYYSWMAATAGSGSSANTAGANAEYSICPKGWQIPSGGAVANSDIFTLMIKAGIESTKEGVNKLRAAPYSFSSYAYFENGAIQNSNGRSGYYWTSTANASNVYYLGFDSSFITMGNDGNYGNYFGYSVRCLARK